MDKKSAGAGVGGWLKQRLAQILLHSSCTTTSATATAFVSLANTNTKANANANAARSIAGGCSRQEPPAAAGPCCAREPRHKIDGSHRRRRRRSSSRALVHISIDCSSVRAAGTTTSARLSSALLPSPPVKDDDVKVKIRARNGGGDKQTLSPSYNCSSTVSDDDELAPFSSDDGEREADTRSTATTLFSSLSFSSDSTSDFYNTTGNSSATCRSSSSSKQRRKNPRRRAATPRGAMLPDGVLRSAASAKKAPKHGNVGSEDKDGGGGVCAAGSTAVVKRSRNPYADFRSSMVEMVVERRIRGADSMGELLVSYLSLNSQRHHPAILAAFKDVWEAVFSGK